MSALFLRPDLYNRVCGCWFVASSVTRRTWSRSADSGTCRSRSPPSGLDPRNARGTICDKYHIRSEKDNILVKIILLYESVKANKLPLRSYENKI